MEMSNCAFGSTSSLACKSCRALASTRARRSRSSSAVSLRAVRASKALRLQAVDELQKGRILLMARDGPWLLLWCDNP